MNNKQKDNLTTKVKEEFQISRETLSFIEECHNEEYPKSQLIAVLHRIQMQFGYLPEPCLDEVAQRLQIPTTIVSGVASFYHFFSLQPKGKYVISVCMGTACFVKGADKILEKLRLELGIEIGETTKDGMFSLDNSRCIGVCALAPVMTINDKVYSQVTPQQIPGIINSIRENME